MVTIDFSSKRAKLAIRFFTYGVMTVASAILTVLLALVALGYRLDRNFNFAQGGLVQFRSFPDNASISVDGKRQSYHTPNKTNLSAGKHTIQMDLAGYHSWSKAVDLAPGQLLWLNYARFIPNSITTSTLKEYPAVTSVLPSPDHRWFLMQLSSGTPDFVLVDYNDEKKPIYTNFQLPESLLSKKDGKIGKIQPLEWDLGSKFVLLKHVNGDTTEFIRLDRSKPADAINLTRMFGLNILTAHFSGNDPNIIFAKNDDVLRRLDVGASSASAALVRGLNDFMVYGVDTIAFTSNVEQSTGDAASQQQEIGIYKGGKITPVRYVGASQQVLFAYNEYDNHSYLAVGGTDAAVVDIIRDSTVTGAGKDTSVYARLNLGMPLQWLTFSDNGRMLVAQHGASIATYDIETDKSYIKTLDLGSGNTPQLKWLDDYYLWSDAGSDLRVVEFDGTNEHEITTVSQGFGVMLSQNGKQLLSIGQNNVTHHVLLQASKLALDN